MYVRVCVCIHVCVSPSSSVEKEKRGMVSRLWVLFISRGLEERSEEALEEALGRRLGGEGGGFI